MDEGNNKDQIDRFVRINKYIKAHEKDIFDPDMIELSRLIVNLDLSLDGNIEWLFYLWIIQVKLDRKPPTPTTRHFIKLSWIRKDPKFRKAYECFCEAWDYGVEHFGGEFEFWLKEDIESMEVEYEKA